MNKVFTNAEGITKENPKAAHAITTQNKKNPARLILTLPSMDTDV